jgi:hypothetical protein
VFRQMRGSLRHWTAKRNLQCRNDGVWNDGDFFMALLPRGGTEESVNYFRLEITETSFPRRARRECAPSC